MPLKLYNSLTKCEEAFQPQDPSEVTMYTCGPTVYGRPHIGNYSSFLMADLLRRWLEAGHGFTVKHVKNITDVGHLVRDADTGEDKIEKQAREEHGEVTHDSVIAIARKYEAEYLEDEKALNMAEPFKRPRASDYVPQMKEMIELLLKNGCAYVTDDGIYFDVTTDEDYGKLSGNTLENLSAGARIEVNEAKRHPADFALWKFCVGSNADHALRWSSPRGPKGETFAEGFPGWHIECSAMSRELLGDQIDLHTGGEDNIFPHHECEIAQSEAVTGLRPFVRLWLHKRRIDLGTEKMSKSLGNVLTIPNISAKHFSPLDLRYYLLSVHYRTPLKFTWKGMEDAHSARRKIMEWLETIDRAILAHSQLTKEELEEMKKHRKKQYGRADIHDEEIAKYFSNFEERMNSDLDTAGALGEVFSFMNFSYAKAFDVYDYAILAAFAKRLRHTFGCFEPEAEAIPSAVHDLVEARAAARAGKNFAESDRLRDEIKMMGYEVRDTGGEQVVKKL